MSKKRPNHDERMHFVLRKVVYMRDATLNLRADRPMPVLLKKASTVFWVIVGWRFCWTKYRG